MNQTLVAALKQHFFEYVRINCYQLLGDRGNLADDGELIFYDTTDNNFVTVAVTAKELTVRRNSFLLKIPVSDPDSIERVERFLQEVNNQLP